MKRDQWILIAKSLSGELTPEEQKHFDLWLASDIENQTLYNESRKIWESSGTLIRDFTPDTDRAWSKMKAEVSAPKVIRMPQKQMNWLQIAASVFLVLTFGFLVRYILNDQPSGTGP